jgi:hypothetical protein
VPWTLTGGSSILSWRKQRMRIMKCNFFVWRTWSEIDCKKISTKFTMAFYVLCRLCTALYFRRVWGETCCTNTANTNYYYNVVGFSSSASTWYCENVTVHWVDTGLSGVTNWTMISNVMLSLFLLICFLPSWTTGFISSQAKVNQIRYPLITSRGASSTEDKQYSVVQQTQTVSDFATGSMFNSQVYVLYDILRVLTQRAIIFPSFSFL